MAISLFIVVSMQYGVGGSVFSIVGNGSGGEEGTTSVCRDMKEGIHIFL